MPMHDGEVRPTLAPWLADADRELCEHYTSGVGARAQRYEPAVTGGESSLEESIMAPFRSRERRQYAIVGACIADVPFADRMLIRLVYAHGTDALSDATDEDGRPMAGKPSGLIQGARNSQDPYGLLRVALAPTWGHGSFLRLAVTQLRARRAYAKKYPAREPAHHDVLDFLAYEAGRGSTSAGMLAELRNECQEARDAVLGVFWGIRVEHRAKAREKRQADDKAEQDKADSQRAQVRAAVQAREVPACLRMTDEQRTRLQRAALAVIEAAERS